jgi:hypothetical protein
MCRIILLSIDSSVDHCPFIGIMGVQRTTHCFSSTANLLGCFVTPHKACTDQSNELPEQILGPKGQDVMMFFMTETGPHVITQDEDKMAGHV